MQYQQEKKESENIWKQNQNVQNNYLIKQNEKREINITRAKLNIERYKQDLKELKKSKNYTPAKNTLCHGNIGANVMRLRRFQNDKKLNEILASKEKRFQEFVDYVSPMVSDEIKDEWLSYESEGRKLNKSENVRF